MNFLTAIIAMPLFVAIWLFELRLFKTSSPGILKEGKFVVALAYVVSTLQMTSCWFWLLGFALGKTDNVLSEAKGPGEEGNCVGLVGAEVLLSIFQYLTTIYTLLQMFVVRFVYTSSMSWKVGAVKRTKGEDAVLAMAVVLGLAYLPIAWITAWNRRCPQATPVWPAVQHYFYTTFLIVDGVTSCFSLYYARDIQWRLDATAMVLGSKLATQQPEDMEEGGSPKKKKSEETKIQQLVHYFTFQCKLTIAGVLLAVSFFILQFGMELKALSMIACVFCTLMYVTYALRRVPMLMKYLRDDHSWRPKSWKTLWDTRHHAAAHSYAPTQSTIEIKSSTASKQAKKGGGNVVPVDPEESGALLHQ